MQTRQSERKKASPDPFSKAREELLVEQIDEIIQKKNKASILTRENNNNSTAHTEDKSMRFQTSAQVEYKGLSEIHEFETGNTPSFEDEKKRESSEKEDTGSSLWNKVHDVVETELYGRSRAVLRRNVDSMICISEKNGKGNQNKK